MITLVIALTAMAAGLRFWELDDQPFWWDEFWTIDYSRLPYLTSLIGDGQVKTIPDDTHPPLYYWMVRLSTRGIARLGIPSLLTGDDEFRLRAPSALLGAATVPVVFLLGRTIAGTQAGLVVALLFAVAPYQVRYAQDARMYTLLTLAVSVALLGLAKVFQTHGFWSSQPSRPGRSAPGSKTGWVAFVVGTATALYTHNLAIFFWVSCNLLMMGLTAAGSGSSALWRRWVLAQAAILVLWLPWIPFLLVQALRVAVGFWVPPPDIESFNRAMMDLYLNPFMSRLPAPEPAWLGWISVALIAATAAYGLWKHRHKPIVLAFVLTPLLIPIAAELGVSLVRPIFLDRTLIWTSVPFLVLIGLAVSAIKPVGVKVALVAALTTLNLMGTAHYYRHDTKEQWNQAAEYVAARRSAGDRIIFFPPRAEVPFDYYYGSARPRMPGTGVPDNFSDDSGWIDWEDFPAGRSVFLVVSHKRPADRDRLVSLLAQKWTLAEQQRVTGINLYRFQIPD